MITALDDAVELLDRSLAYTRVSLADVTDDTLGRPTPCTAWTLGSLLAHMEDALDAFLEATHGEVRVDPPAPAPAQTQVRVLREKACALLGAWSHGAPGEVAVGDHRVAGSLLVATAALEITVHGWDVGQSTGRAAPIPDDLARRLLDVAENVVTGSDRGVRFGAARPSSAEAPYDERLLVFLGRHPSGPPWQNRTIAATHQLRFS